MKKRTNNFLRGVRNSIIAVGAVIMTCGIAKLFVKQNPQKVSSFMSGVKNIGAHKVKFTPLYMENCMHKKLLKELTKDEIEDKLEIKDIYYKDKDGVSFYFKKIDILKGTADEVSKRYPEILKGCNLVLFLYNVDDYCQKGTNYILDVVDRIAVASELTEKSCSFYITPVTSQNKMKEKLANESKQKIRDLLREDVATKGRKYECTCLCNMSDKDCVSSLMSKCLEKNK